MAAFNPQNIVSQDITDGTGILSAGSRTRSNSAFIPELWEDETIAVYKSNLVMPQMTVVMNHVGKKGDTVHVPRPNREEALQKAADTPVTVQATQETQTPYLIDQHWYRAKLIEDIATLQANDRFRQFYTDDFGYSLAKRIDIQLHLETQLLNAAGIGTVTDPTAEANAALDGAVVGALSSGALVQWDPTASSDAGNAAALTDEAIRRFIRVLDDNDVPVMGRYLVIPPVEKENLLGINRFTEQSFVGEVGDGNSIRNGMIGNVYAVEVFVSTNCTTDTADDDTTEFRVASMFQEEALVLIEQQRPRFRTQGMLEFMGELMVADNVFGTGILRPEAGLAICVPA
jgi:hypothetical protein